MASEEQKKLAEFLKNVHSALRKSSSKIGAEKAWVNHCENHSTLATYAHCMEKLATTHWEANSVSEWSEATSRIKWSVKECFDYFINKSYLKYRHKEIDIAEKNNMNLNIEELFTEPLQLIDVGSCYNPFKVYDIFNVFAIDLCPANDSVFQCDFLNVSLGDSLIVERKEVKQLKVNYFDIATFCFLLEYIPSSKQRVTACENAYRILKPGGLLIINSPDSKHVGANYKIIKNWRYTLACIGFTRIKYEKLKHMHCMVFRKALCKDTAVRWSKIYKEPYMIYSIHIPQDFQKLEDKHTSVVDKIQLSADDFNELPFCSTD